MAEIDTTKLVTIGEITANLSLYKRNPSSIQRVIFDLLDEVSGGQAKVVDPTSPFAFLLESSATNTAFSINEATSLLALQYSSLSQTADDLYHHMSDKDYINRFAVPSEATYIVTIPVSELISKLIWDADKNAYHATIPRDTYYGVDGLSFTMTYPIDIYRFENGVVQISYDTTIDSSIGNLESNIIPYQVKKQPDLTQILFFKVRVKQFAINSNQFRIASSGFKQNVLFTDQFYLARVFYQNNATNNAWKEIAVTHSDMVYDLNTPTAALTVYDGSLDVSIPKIYLTNNQVSGNLRVDIYTTKGALIVNLANYSVDAFTMHLEAIDDVRDTNVYTAAFSNMSYYAYSSDEVTGGSFAIGVDKLRDRVITNSNGPQVLPITNKNVPAAAEALGFDLVPNVDILTNRIFLATQKLPKPTNPKLATSANITLGTFTTNIEYLSTFPTVATNTDRSTILSNNLYRSENGIITILTAAEVATLKAMTKLQLTIEVNSKNYLYSPYYYVLDDSDNEFALRAYDLDYPTAKDISFESQNQSLQLPVNTNTYTFEKIGSGYRLSVLTSSGNFYKLLPDANVFTQLAFKPVGETKFAYINGVLSDKDTDGNRLWTFDILTDYNINSSDNITITNGKMFSDDVLDTPNLLSQTFHIFYATNSITAGFVPDEADAMLGKFILPSGVVADTHETLTLELGKSLKNLWTRSRSVLSGLVYETYLTDEPLYYDSKVYEINPVTGSTLFFGEGGVPHRELLHDIGDPVLDNQGNQIYKHRQGDVVLDQNGQPIVSTAASVDKEIDMLFVDGRQYFVDDPAFLAYNDELVAVLDDWIVDDLKSLQQRLLEQTYVFFYPKSTIGAISVYTSDNGRDVISAEQSIQVDYYVKSDVYKDETVRGTLTSNTITLLDDYISRSVVNVTEIREALKAMVGSSVNSLKVSGLGGDKDYQILTLVNEQNRLGLKRTLDLQLNGKLIMKEAVEVNYFLIP